MKKIFDRPVTYIFIVIFIYALVPGLAAFVVSPAGGARLQFAEKKDEKHFYARVEFEKYWCDFQELYAGWKPHEGLPYKGNYLSVDYGQAKINRPAGSHSDVWTVESPTNGKTGVVTIYVQHECLWRGGISTPLVSIDWPLERGAYDDDDNSG